MAGPANGKDKTPEELEYLQIHNDIVKLVFKTLNASTPEDEPVIYNKIAVAALLKVASVLAVDNDIPVDRFAKICELNYAEAITSAPRFG